MSHKFYLNEGGAMETRFNFKQYYKPNEPILNLSYKKKITSKDIPYIFEFLNHHPEIKVLILYGCKLGDECVTTLATELASNTTLIAMVLRENNISDVGAIALAKALASNTRLEELTLGFNHIGNMGAKALAGTRLLDLIYFRIKSVIRCEYYC